MIRTRRSLPATIDATVARGAATSAVAAQPKVTIENVKAVLEKALLVRSKMPYLDDVSYINGVLAAQDLHDWMAVRNGNGHGVDVAVQLEKSDPFYFIVVQY